MLNLNASCPNFGHLIWKYFTKKNQKFHFKIYGLNKLLRKTDTDNRVEELMLSQEGHLGTHRTAREISQKTNPEVDGISLHPQGLETEMVLKEKRTQGLTGANKLSLLTCAKKLTKFPIKCLQ